MTDTLFTPTKLGDIEIANRVVMAPLTRTRGTADHCPTALMATYYAQTFRSGHIFNFVMAAAAVLLGLSHRTVEHRLDKMKQRYGARNTVHLVAMLIAAHIDRLALEMPAEQGFGPGTGFFGYFDAEDEHVARALLTTAEGWLAGQGIALFAVDYRRATHGPVFPGNAQDVRAALLFLADQAGSLGLDADRLAERFSADIERIAAKIRLVITTLD